MTRCLRLIAALFLALIAQAGGAFGAAPVLLVLSEADAIHQEAAAAITAGLPLEAEAEQLFVQALAPEALEKRRVVVTVGSRAAQAVAELAPPTPVLHALIARASYAQLPPAHRTAGRSAIFLDQPPARQIALIRLALPEIPRIALLSSPASEEMADELAAAARAQGLDVVGARVDADRELFVALQRVFAEPAVLLATPDPAVFNGYTVQNVLLTAYRRRSPVVGFSPAYARAGALLALYSTPTQVGQQAAEAVRAVLRNGSLPQPAAPRRFEVAVNANVARSLGLRLPAAEALTRSLLRQEQGE
ncbi:hypothetical protein E6C76_15240 [Pseudothauera nasutitermitis]|uniref:ABC transporter substrate-binding protein n=1 Tax=Pseudothauera nasutitermitis TaxID=2565930 RepID=A0A4S4AV87_9RHOO|nr:ABC transporter substrate binding protein [Pseudothauera nasutitermitis]THF63927.1 hypothetical protein E6C76_15240 [Pseudothauera nasutitermitis]